MDVEAAATKLLLAVGPAKGVVRVRVGVAVLDLVGELGELEGVHEDALADGGQLGDVRDDDEADAEGISARRRAGGKLPPPISRNYHRNQLGIVEGGNGKRAGAGRVPIVAVGLLDLGREVGLAVDHVLVGDDDGVGEGELSVLGGHVEGKASDRWGRVDSSSASS